MYGLVATVVTAASLSGFVAVGSGSATVVASVNVVTVVVGIVAIGGSGVVVVGKKGLGSSAAVVRVGLAGAAGDSSALGGCGDAPAIGSAVVANGAEVV